MSDYRVKQIYPCPVCKGTGILEDTWLRCARQCETCKGYKIQEKHVDLEDAIIDIIKKSPNIGKLFIRYGV